MPNKPSGSNGLSRSLGLTSLVLYGMGTIIGAGIYVLAGEVAAEAGMAAPLSFLFAGVLAALTALSYAELSARHPEAAGAAAYVRHGFRSEILGRVTGVAIGLIAVVSAASIARGGVGYLVELIPLFTAPVAGGLIVALFIVLACWGVRESVMVAATMTVAEIAGLLLVITAGAPDLAALPARLPEMAPDSALAWAGIGGGAFLAFFAFTGFENLAVMAEETRDVTRVLPKAILLAIGFTTVLYMTVLVVAVLAVAPADLAASQAPLAEVTDKAGWLEREIFLLVAIIATLNGVLIEIMMVSRLTYGMANRGWLPRALAVVHPVRRTPMRATLVMGAVVMVLTVAVPFEALVRITSALILMVFVAVNLALWRLHRSEPRADLPLRAPSWAPPVAAASCLVLMVIEILA